MLFLFTVCIHYFSKSPCWSELQCFFYESISKLKSSICKFPSFLCNRRRVLQWSVVLKFNSLYFSIFSLHLVLISNWQETSFRYQILSCFCFVSFSKRVYFSLFCCNIFIVCIRKFHRIFPLQFSSTFLWLHLTCSYIKHFWYNFWWIIVTTFHTSTVYSHSDWYILNSLEVLT